MENKKQYGATECQKAVERMLQQVNADFKGGRVRKKDLVDWILIEFEKKYFSENIEAIRQKYFDQARFLEQLVKDLKKAKKSGTGSTPLKEILAACHLID